MIFRGTWRDYQARILEEMDEHFGDGRLHVVAAPGAGKTVLGLEIVRRIGRPALVFAPTIAIREQWAHRLCPLFLDTPPDAEATSHDLVELRELTLATYQALDSLRRGEELDALIKKLNGRGPLTLVLDEAHHLRREWWKCLNQMANLLQDVRLVALTATPPYDASFAEWSRYEELCGPIDLEIGIPELVRNSWLGLKKRVDYHAVPAALGAHKENAERFADLWRGGVGSSKLVFTRTAEGRRILLRARASSFAAGFQRTVDRRSVWL